MGNRYHMTGVASDQDSLTVEFFVPNQVKEKFKVLIIPLALSSSISIAAMRGITNFDTRQVALPP